MKRICIAVMAVALVLFSAAGLWAQAAKGAQESKAQPQAQKQDGLRKDFEAFDLGELYVKGDKIPASENITQRTEITAEEIEATHSLTVAEALAHVPGITVTTGRKNEPNVSIYGLGQNKVLVLIDGVPYYETYYGKLDLNSIPVDNIAKIEVQKGVSSVLYGPNGLAGIINIVTKKPTTRPSLDARLEIGDYRFNRQSISHGMKVGMFNYWVGYDRQESKGWLLSDDFQPRQTRIRYQPPPNRTVVLEDGGKRENSDYKTDALWAKFGIEPTPDSEYYVNFHYITREKGGPASLLDDANRVFTNRPAFSQLWRFPTYDNWGADLSGQQRFGDRVTVRAKLFYHDHIDDLKSFRNPDYTGFLSLSRYKDYMLGGSVLSDVKVSNIDTLRLSFNYRQDDHQERADTYLPFQENVSYTGSLAAENELTPIKNLSIVAGLAYDWWDVTKAEKTVTDQNGNFVRFDRQRKPDDSQFSPMVGATYTFDEGTRLFGSWAKKIRFPTLSVLYSSSGGNPDLKPEKSMNYILGASRAITQYARAEASLFYFDVDDLIQRPSPDTLIPYQNVGKVRLYGAEVIGEVFPTKDLRFRAGYTYTNATDKSPGTPTERVLYTPSHKLDLTMTYLMPLGVNLDLNALYVGRMWNQLPSASSPSTQALRTGDYFILGGRISRVFAKHYEFYIFAHNILDKDYESEIGFPAPGRMFFGGVKYTY